MCKQFSIVLSVIELEDGDTVTLGAIEETVNLYVMSTTHYKVCANNSLLRVKAVKAPWKKPSSSQASTVFKLFMKKKRSLNLSFNPLLPIEARGKKKKKQKSTPCNAKPPNKLVMMLKKDQATKVVYLRSYDMQFLILLSASVQVPKRHQRKTLEKRELVCTLKLYHYIDSNDIRQKISESFKWVKSYTVLEPTGGVPDYGSTVCTSCVSLNSSV